MITVGFANDWLIIWWIKFQSNCKCLPKNITDTSQMGWHNMCRKKLHAISLFLVDSMRIPASAYEPILRFLRCIVSSWSCSLISWIIEMKAEQLILKVFHTQMALVRLPYRTAAVYYHAFGAFAALPILILWATYSGYFSALCLVGVVYSFPKSVKWRQNNTLLIYFMPCNMIIWVAS